MTATDPSTAPAAPATGRTGRNLPLATAVGVGLAALVVLSLCFAMPIFVGIAALACAVAVIELGSALRTAGVRLPVVPLVVGGVATVNAAYIGGPTALVASFTLTVLASVAWRAFEGVDGFVRDASAAVFVAAYVPLLIGFALLCAREEDGAARVIAFVALAAASDTGGFFAGVFFGKHRMAPTISPKKSWEGSAGSVLAAGLVGSLLVPLFLDITWWQGLVLGLVVVVTATVGDLGESLIKRDLGVKDMSNLLPGHGGLLDRLDSLLLTAPVAWLLFAWFLGTSG